MEMIWIILLMLLNVAISTWNCFAVGASWKDVMTLGGRLERWTIYGAIVHSTVGFSFPILLALAYFGTPLFFEAEQVPQVMESIFALWWVLVIVPVVGFGFIIWAQSVQTAIRRRDPASIGIAAWNTFAQVSNTISMIGNMGQMLDITFKAMKDAKQAIFIVLVAAISLGVGFYITMKLVGFFARRTESYMEKLQREGKAPA